MKCPKCNHLRQASDDAPDWQCPRCGIAYAKVLHTGPDALKPLPDPQIVQTHAASNGNSTRVIALVTGIIVCTALVLFTRQGTDPGTAAMTPAGDIRVVMFATSTCGYCKRARAFFARHQIKYFEYDINHSPEGKRMFRALNGRGVPLILVDKQRLDGFDERRLGRVARNAGLI